MCVVVEVMRGVEKGLVSVSFPCVFGFLSACRRCGERSWCWSLGCRRTLWRLEVGREGLESLVDGCLCGGAGR